jgi:hypothetical protein
MTARALVTLAVLLAACAGADGSAGSVGERGDARGGASGDAGGVEPLTPRQASLLAETLHRNHEATGAAFSLVALDAASGATLTLEGVVDWRGTQGRARVDGYVDADGPVVEIAWTRDAVAELRPTQIELLASRGEPPGTFLLRRADPQKHPLDRLVAILTGLATLQPDNAQLILQNPGAGFLRDDVLRGRDVAVMRYSERSVYWVDPASGELMRFEGRDSLGGSPVLVDLLELGPRVVELPQVSSLPLRP